MPGEFTTRKPPILTLKLSSTSFLNCIITDDAQNHSLYDIKTNGMSTVVWRNVKESGDVLKIADIRWPKPVQNREKRRLGVLVQMRGERWTTGEHYLAPAGLLGAHKFNIHGYSQSLKWKRSGLNYHCTTKALKTPIAVVETSLASHPPRIAVLETLHDKYDASALSMHSGVSLLLLDHLVATALLLVTDPFDWMTFEDKATTPISPTMSRFGIARILSTRKLRPDKPDASPPVPSTTTTRPQRSNSVGMKWKKFRLGDMGVPVPHLSTSSAARRGVDTISKQTTSAQIAKVVHGEPMYPKLSTENEPEAITPTTEHQDDASTTYDDDQSDAISQERAEVFHYLTSHGADRPYLRHYPTSMNPSMPSVLLTPAAIPNHPFLDPSFYSDSSEDFHTRTRPHTADDDRERHPGRLGFAHPPPSVAPSISSSTAIRALPPIPQSPPLASAGVSRHPSSASHASPQPSSRRNRYPELTVPEDEPLPELSPPFAEFMGRPRSNTTDDSNSSPTTTIGRRRVSELSNTSTVVATSPRNRRPNLPPVPSLPSSPSGSSSIPNSSSSSSYSRSLPSPPPLRASFSRLPVSEFGALSPDRQNPLPPHPDVPPLPKMSALDTTTTTSSALSEKVSLARQSASPRARDTVFNVPPPAYHSIDFHIPSPFLEHSNMPLFGPDPPPVPLSPPPPLSPTHYETAAPTPRATQALRTSRSLHSVREGRPLPQPPQRPQVATVGMAGDRKQAKGGEPASAR